MAKKKEGSYELIITEKPKTAQKIAQALADGKPIAEKAEGILYYRITRGNKDIVVSCAVGHIYSLTQKDKNGWTYPVFDIEWRPSYEVSKGAAFTKKYVASIKKLAKGASEFTVATDYDVEGEVIGLNVIRYACGEKDARRMKFSTLTKPDLEKAYEAAEAHLDWGQANAGETRHILDWYYGINLSRALTLAIKSTGAFKILSSGRVQGPALKIIVDREREIKAFKPEPYWQIELLSEADGKAIDAMHEKDKFFEKKEADSVFSKVDGKPAKVADVAESRFNQEPPHPFDLTTLQTEAYRVHHISPKMTLQIAQGLYTEGFISYPRTSSQVLPPELGYKKLIKDLSSQENYRELCEMLLSRKELKPNNGKKTDPAHPAIHPTGITPKNLDERDAKVYDLIARRFLATFGDTAVRETVTLKIDVNSEIFVAKGTRTIEHGWHTYYGKYANMKEEELPAVKKGESLKVDEIKMLAKETQPPKRYTPASIIKELTKRNLGTKATRAVIVETLFDRGYVKGEAIEATDLGIHTTEILEKYAPEILDEELTKHFEEEMEKIREHKRTPPEILAEARDVLTKTLSKFKKSESNIGTELQSANVETRKQERIVGKCPVCKVGDLRIMKAKASGKRFIACNKYPDCKTTFSLPQDGAVKATKKPCPQCNYPVVSIVRKGKRPWQLCINLQCPSKEEYNARRAEMANTNLDKKTEAK